jgi:hypothetical protein
VYGRCMVAECVAIRGPYTASPMLTRPAAGTVAVMVHESPPTSAGSGDRTSREQTVLATKDRAHFFVRTQTPSSILQCSNPQISGLDILTGDGRPSLLSDVLASWNNSNGEQQCSHRENTL